MSTFTGQKIANSYKNLLQVNTSNSDLSSTLIAVETGAGNSTPLQLATDKVNIGGTFQIGGVALTANVTALNNIADLSDKWLSFACEYGFTQICLKLLDLNLNVNHRCNITGWTPLLLASEKGYIDCINALINKGADINMKAITPSGWTSLHGGSEYGHCDVVLKLINNGAIIDDIDHSGKTPLMISCLNGNVKLTKLLLENGANYNILNNEGRSALALASYNGHIENISLLVMWGANFSKSDLEKKNTITLFII